MEKFNLQLEDLKKIVNATTLISLTEDFTYVTEPLQISDLHALFRSYISLSNTCKNAEEVTKTQEIFKQILHHNNISSITDITDKFPNVDPNKLLNSFNTFYMLLDDTEHNINVKHLFPQQLKISNIYFFQHLLDTLNSKRPDLLKNEAIQKHILTNTQKILLQTTQKTINKTINKKILDSFWNIYKHLDFSLVTFEAKNNYFIEQHLTTYVIKELPTFLKNYYIPYLNKHPDQKEYFFTHIFFNCSSGTQAKDNYQLPFNNIDFFTKKIYEALATTDFTEEEISSLRKHFAPINYIPVSILTKQENPQNLLNDIIMTQYHEKWAYLQPANFDFLNEQVPKIFANNALTTLINNPDFIQAVHYLYIYDYIKELPKDIFSKISENNLNHFYKKLYPKILTNEPTTYHLSSLYNVYNDYIETNNLNEEELQELFYDLTDKQINVIKKTFVFYKGLIDHIEKALDKDEELFFEGDPHNAITFPDKLTTKSYSFLTFIILNNQTNYISHFKDNILDTKFKTPKFKRFFASQYLSSTRDLSKPTLQLLPQVKTLIEDLKINYDNNIDKYIIESNLTEQMSIEATAPPIKAKNKLKI